MRDKNRHLYPTEIQPKESQSKEQKHTSINFDLIFDKTPIKPVADGELKKSIDIDYRAILQAFNCIDQNHETNFRRHSEKKQQLIDELKRIEITSDEKL